MARLAPGGVLYFSNNFRRFKLEENAIAEFAQCREITARTPKPVVASGGIANLDDIAALRDLVPLGVEGAIVGKALYAGAFTLAEALDVAG